MSFFSRLFGRGSSSDEQPESSGATAGEAAAPAPDTTPPAPRKGSRLAEVSARCPFPLLAFPGDVVEKTLLRLRKNHAGQAVPVIIGDAESALRLLDTWEPDFDLAKHQQLAQELNVDAWLAEQRAEAAQDWDEEAQAEQREIYPDGTQPITRLTVGHDYKGRAHPKVFIALIPTADPALVPLYLQFGGWNACPRPHEHVAFARRWSARHGVEVASIAFDVMEFTVERPPKDLAEAEALASEMYFYCNDIVEQGVGSVATLARALLKSTRWYFWWD